MVEEVKSYCCDARTTIEVRYDCANNPQKITNGHPTINDIHPSVIVAVSNTSESVDVRIKSSAFFFAIEKRANTSKQDLNDDVLTY